MYRNLNEKERKWIEKILDIEFKGRETLLKQTINAKVIVEQGFDYISLKFKMEEKIEKYPYKVRVPVEMRVFQKESVPIIFLLHIVNGVIDELEIITADSSRINPRTINLENVEYEINENIL